MGELDKTSDIEIVRELVKRLGLIKSDEQDNPLSMDYYDGPNKHTKTDTFYRRSAPHVIVFGPGIGHDNFSCVFSFNNDKLIDHGVWE